MQAQSIAIKNTGLVSSVGLSAPATCAAIRANVTNPTETRFIDSDGEWIMGHQVSLEKPWRGRTKLAKMAAMAISECLTGVQRAEWASMPLLLCVAERERPGRLEGLEDQLFQDIQQELDARFAPESAIVAHGRVGAAIALARARKLIHEHNTPHVLIVAADSLLTWPTLSVYERGDRLLTPRNSNGFMPGEAGGALLLGLPGNSGELLCTGIGFGVEKAHIDSGEPLRADGLTLAVKGALADAVGEMHDLDYRITDLSGEQYYFKETALMLARTLRRRKEAFDIWHPAECIGESGAAAGIAVLAVADAACRKAYTLGPRILMHLANDSGQRAAAVLHYAGMQ
jgi:3-oxoacyl-[acyl-carrier-protein] synthase-1